MLSLLKSASVIWTNCRGVCEQITVFVATVKNICFQFYDIPGLQDEAIMTYSGGNMTVPGGIKWQGTW